MSVFRSFILGLIGFSAGFIVSGGVVALMVGLGILTRFVGLSHTADKISWYENSILLGTVFGTLSTVFSYSFPLGKWFLSLSGLFIGIFVGGWIMALAEVIHVFPVYFRRLGITLGLSWIVVSMAIGKLLGCLLFFYERW